MLIVRSSLVVRWTVGDVSIDGFESLRLSAWGARQIFGSSARYVICVNSVPLEQARSLTGRVPSEVEWLDVSQRLSPAMVRHMDGGMVEGVGWKFAPMRLDPDRWELHLDNDCILWRAPAAIDHWLNDNTRCLLAEDVATMLGQFQAACGPAPRNSGIRGLPPGFDFERACSSILSETGISLRSELDEQGLVTLACSKMAQPHVVSTGDVTICGPFPPHVRQLGRCGAHFVGLNAKRLNWSHEGRSGDTYVRENWERMRPALYAAVQQAGL
jgi:hypothetical protein